MSSLRCGRSEHNRSSSSSLSNSTRYLLQLSFIISRILGCVKVLSLLAWENSTSSRLFISSLPGNAATLTASSNDVKPFSLRTFSSLLSSKLFFLSLYAFFNMYMALGTASLISLLGETMNASTCSVYVVTEPRMNMNVRPVIRITEMMLAFVPIHPRSLMDMRNVSLP